MAHTGQIILLAGDSRLRGMDQHMRRALDEVRAYAMAVECIVVPGGEIAGVARAVRMRSQRAHYDRIFFFAGVCDMMIKRSARNLVPHFASVDDMVLYMGESYAAAQQVLLGLSDSPVMCEIVGLDIATYNVKGRTYPFYQDFVNEAVPIINRQLNALNASIETMPRAPYLASYIHKTRRGKLTHRYDLALNDGLHFTEYYKQRIARALTGSIAQG